ncbi:hypothetical protein FACS189494_02410 [Spirochaetia bacterium]|nr:hypothetical protein FACS189494_02410 [Spirochaetia bacterium]
MKTTKKWSKMLIFGLLISLSAFLFTGCGTMGGAMGDAVSASSPGTLVITGIPGEYEGKFVSLSTLGLGEKVLSSLIDSAAPPKDEHGTGTVIKNGEVKLSLYTVEKNPFNPFNKYSINGYVGNDTGTVGIRIRDTAEPVYPENDTGIDAVFESITFENGAASAAWDAAFKSGSITITGIPDEFNGREVTVLLGYGGNKMTAAAEKRLMGNSIRDGKVTIKIISYTVTGTKDIVLSISTNRAVQNLFENAFLFKAAQINNGKVVLDFAKGIKQ